ncbi:2-oxoacid:acceptor oxidoreductase subunit alpha [Chloroflexota bacterium]
MSNRILAGTHLFQGDEACVEGAMAAGCDLFAGYPITPATEISERLSRRLFDVGGIFVQGADELDSLTIVIGAACAGHKAMTATSGNGICLMQECIGYAAITETPCVIVDVQRAGPGTGIATKTASGDVYQVRYGSNADYAIIALAPESPQEMFDLTVEAFNLSETYRVPTFILADEIVGHMREKVIIPDKVSVINRKKPSVSPDDFIPYKAESDTDIPPMPAFGDGYRMPVSGLTHNEAGVPSNDYEVQKAMVTRLCNKVEKKVEQLTKIESEHLEDAGAAAAAYPEDLIQVQL